MKDFRYKFIIQRLDGLQISSVDITYRYLKFLRQIYFFEAIVFSKIIFSSSFKSVHNSGSKFNVFGSTTQLVSTGTNTVPVPYNYASFKCYRR